MNVIPDSLQELINKFLKDIESDANFDLSMGRREAILWEFGPYLFARNNADKSGYLRRLHLANLVVRHVMSHWHKSFPDDKTPLELLDRAKWVGENRNVRDKVTVNDDAISLEIERAEDYVMNLFEETYDIAAAVGFAAVDTLNLALWDGFTDSDSDDIDYSKVDSMEFESNDVHCLAAAVFSNGPVVPIEAAPDSDPKKREEFWRWWLQTAVPEAWNSVKQTE